MFHPPTPPPTASRLNSASSPRIPASQGIDSPLPAGLRQTRSTNNPHESSADEAESIPPPKRQRRSLQLNRQESREELQPSPSKVMTAASLPKPNPFTDRNRKDRMERKEILASMIARVHPHLAPVTSSNVTHNGLVHASYPQDPTIFTAIAAFITNSAAAAALFEKSTTMWPKSADRALLEGFFETGEVRCVLVPEEVRGMVKVMKGKPGHWTWQGKGGRRGMVAAIVNAVEAKEKGGDGDGDGAGEVVVVGKQREMEVELERIDTGEGIGGEAGSGGGSGRAKQVQIELGGTQADYEDSMKKAMIERIRLVEEKEKEAEKVVWEHMEVLKTLREEKAKLQNMVSTFGG